MQKTERITMSKHVIFTFTKEDKICYVHSCFVTATREKADNYFVISGWNPLPIMGTFHSSRKVLFAWLEKEGWKIQPGVNTYVNQERVTIQEI